MVVDLGVLVGNFTPRESTRSAMRCSPAAGDHDRLMQTACMIFSKPASDCETVRMGVRLERIPARPRCTGAAEHAVLQRQPPDVGNGRPDRRSRRHDAVQDDAAEESVAAGHREIEFGFDRSSAGGAFERDGSATKPSPVHGVALRDRASLAELRQRSNVSAPGHSSRIGRSMSPPSVRSYRRSSARTLSGSASDGHGSRGGRRRGRAPRRCRRPGRAPARREMELAVVGLAA
jgi:hypothetical protein